MTPTQQKNVRPLPEQSDRADEHEIHDEVVHPHVANHQKNFRKDAVRLLGQ